MNPKPKNLPRLEGVMPTAKGQAKPTDSSMSPKDSHSTNPRPKAVAGSSVSSNGFSMGAGRQNGGSGVEKTFTDSPDIKVTTFTPTMNENPAKTRFIQGSGNGVSK